MKRSRGDHQQHHLRGGAVWSGSERAVKVVRRIRTGQVDINGVPFNGSALSGGYEQSGNGRKKGV